MRNIMKMYPSVITHSAGYITSLFSPQMVMNSGPLK